MEHEDATPEVPKTSIVMQVTGWEAERIEAQVSERLAEWAQDAIRKQLSNRIETAVENAMLELGRERIGQEVERVLAEGWTETDNYGSPKGPKKSIKDRISAKRFMDHEDGRDLVLLYLGDHDPSGEDMVRDVRERLEMFGAELRVEKIALTMTQVRKYNPPPNPAKVTDSRAAGYIAKHGDSSWEVDALPPRVLAATIRDTMSEIVDQDAMDEVIAREDKDKEYLRKAVSTYKGAE